MNYTLVLSAATQADIIGALDWYEDQREGLGMQLELCIEAGLTYIQRSPKLCAKKYQDVRVHYIARFPYGLHYEIEEDRIKILGFFHMKRDPLRWIDRLNQS